MHRFVVCTSLVCFASAVAAQQSARPDPADPKAVAPGRAYDSAFKDYRPSDPEIARWREVNDDAVPIGFPLLKLALAPLALALLALASVTFVDERAKGPNGSQITLSQGDCQMMAHSGNQLDDQMI